MPITCTCLNCGVQFPAYPSAIRRGVGKFCGRPCDAAYKRVGSLDAYGYRRLTVNGKTVKEHRVVMEQHLGRILSPEEIVHHRDEVRTNNTISNLEITTHVEHAKHHHPLTWDVE